MTVFQPADAILRFAGTTTIAAKSLWPRQAYPWYEDYKAQRVVANEVLSRAIDILQSGSSLLIIGKPYTGKTVLVRHIASELFDRCSFRFYDVTTTHDASGDLTAEFVESLNTWTTTRARRVAVLEDIHESGFDLLEFLAQVEAFPVQWLLTSRSHLKGKLAKLPVLTVSLTEQFLLKIAENSLRLMENAQPSASAQQLVDEVAPLGGDLRALSFLIRVPSAPSSPDISLTERLFEFLDSEYLLASNRDVLFRLAALSQYGVKVRKEFFTDLDESKLPPSLSVERFESAQRTAIRLDPAASRWLLLAAERRGKLPTTAQAFTHSVLCDYLLREFDDTLETLALVASVDLDYARSLLVLPELEKVLARWINPKHEAEGLKELFTALELTQSPADWQKYIYGLSGVGFARAVRIFSRTEEGRQTLLEWLKADVELFQRKLSTSGNLLAYWLVMNAFSYSAAAIQRLCAGLAYDGCFAQVPNFTLLRGYLDLMNNVGLGNLFLGEIATIPVDKLAAAAQRSSLRSVGEVLKALRTVSLWNTRGFLESMGSLEKHLQFTRPRNLSTFLMSLKRSSGRVEPVVLALWNQWSWEIARGYKLDLFDDLTELRYVCDAVSKDARRSLLNRLLQEKAVLHRLINNSTVLEVSRMLRDFITPESGCKYQAEALLASFNDSDWDRLLQSAYLDLAISLPTLISIAEMLRFQALPVPKMRERLQLILGLPDTDLAQICRETSLGQFASLCQAYGEDRTAISRLWSVVTENLCKVWIQVERDLDVTAGAVNGLVKLLQLASDKEAGVPAWLTWLVTNYPYSKVPPTPQGVLALNSLWGQLRRQEIADPELIESALTALVYKNPVVLINYTFTKDWLWNQLHKDLSSVTHTVQKYEQYISKAAIHAVPRDLIFLLWNLWLISPEYAAHIGRVVYSKIGGFLTTARDSAPWQRVCLRAISQILGLQFGFEPQEEDLIRKILAESRNPGTHAMLYGVLAKLGRPCPPEQVETLALQYPESVRSRIYELLSGSK